MLDLFQILQTTLITPARDVLNNRTFTEVQTVSSDVFNRLNSLILVVATSHLNV